MAVLGEIGGTVIYCTHKAGLALAVLVAVAPTQAAWPLLSAARRIEWLIALAPDMI